MATLLDELSEFEHYREQILPSLRDAVRNGKSASDIYKLAQSVAAARAVTIAATETDSGKALAAIREILDREGGKAVERRENTHKYEKLKEEELDSLLLSELSDVELDSKH